MGGNQIKVLALDQSTKVTGWCIFHDGELVDSGSIDLHTIKDSKKRINQMYEEMVRLITNDCDTVIIEDTQYQNNAQSYKILCQLQGMLFASCYQNNINVKVVKPSEWRKKLGFYMGRGIKRKELKKQAIHYVQANFGESYKNEDECEAICIMCSEIGLD